MDAKKVSEAIGSLSGAMSVLEGGTKTEISKQRIQESTPIQKQDETSDAVNRVSQAVIDANEMMEKGHGPTITLEEAEEGFKVRIPTALLFKKGDAKIVNQDIILFLKRLALIINELPNDFEINVQGHTDNKDLDSSSPYKDNWELSTARAISVVKELIKNGVDPKRLSAAGFANYRPIATNATEKGREKNRRVEIYFYGKKSSNEDKLKKSVLDKVKSK